MAPILGRALHHQKEMKIEVITTYYREEFLAPLFILHYEPWTDKITMLTSRFPDNKMDDAIKMDLVNDAIAESRADWVVVVDFDEFVFPVPVGTDPRKVLAEEKADIIRCPMLRVWRHRTDRDIDRMQPPLLQRVYGEKDHVKDCVFRPKGVRIGIGHHEVFTPAGYQWGKNWCAVHWANADPCFGINRTRRDRQTRLSDRNLYNRWGSIPEWLAPGYLEQLYAQHLDDPQVIQI
jgi:hypothetical protein